MKWRHWSILIVLALLNYIIFRTAFTQLAEQRRLGPRPTRTPQPTFESIEPTPIAWIVLPTSTLPPTKTPITPPPAESVASAPQGTLAPQSPTSTEIAATEVPPTLTEVVVEPTDVPPTDVLPTATLSGETVTHTVKRGETLSEIAKQYDVPVQSIVAANALEDPNRIITGQKLVIPEPDWVPPTVTPVSETMPAGTPNARFTDTPKPTNTKPPAPTPTSELPSTTPTPTASKFQFTAEVIWDPLIAPNCSGPAVAKQSIIRDTNGDPVNGVRIEMDCYGNRWLSHASGTPGEYDPGHYDFSLGQIHPQDWLCTARAFDLHGQQVDSSQIVVVQFDTNDCDPHGAGHQVAIVNWTKHW
jgi:LysM repeat protein